MKLENADWRRGSAAGSDPAGKGSIPLSAAERKVKGIWRNLSLTVRLMTCVRISTLS